MLRKPVSRKKNLRGKPKKLEYYSLVEQKSGLYIDKLPFFHPYSFGEMPSEISMAFA